MRQMPYQLDSQWTRSAAAAALGIMLALGLLRADEGLRLPSELRPVAELVSVVVCVLAPGPPLTAPGVAPRLDAARAGR